MSTTQQTHAIAYTFPNGTWQQAEAMFRRLNYERLSPKWEIGKNQDGWHIDLILLPLAEMPALRYLQKTNPARYGNHPDTDAMLRAP